MSTMVREDAQALLQKYHEESYQKKIYPIGSRIRLYVGYGHSNCIVIEGDESLILIDTLDSDVRAEALKKELKTWTNKPVKTIIYTHGHPDHRGGGAAFADTHPEVIAFAPKRPALKYMDKLNNVLGQRTTRQFGQHLNESELITQGLGIREGQFCKEGTYQFLLPTTVYQEDKVSRTIDGVKLEMISAVGETDDQIFVWLPEEKVICCGDNYYGCFPNLYAIRGSQYRDIAAWIDSLGEILGYPAEVLLPGHTKPIVGYDQIQEVLGTYRDAIETILLQTLDCMNRGMSESDTVASVKLPEEYQNKPYLGEYYGTIDWSVRAIYHGYIGWFDGNPTNLNPLPDEMYASKLIELVGAQKLKEEIQSTLERKENAAGYQLVLQLCDLFMKSGVESDWASDKKQQALRALACVITSANGRHYYLESARELEERQRK